MGIVGSGTVTAGVNTGVTWSTEAYTSALSHYIMQRASTREVACKDVAIGKICDRSCNIQRQDNAKCWRPRYRVWRAARTC
ncbi:hypothetical protein L915_06459 [Phytophthora nicotianae]|uniref:Uncharacterized protein n=2 Tax=Phytophthora nicotianae TaxID=4792 RepID=W2H2R4_PHYNI|nr:hypothetical protein L915_06459 [Phytophthora nicotianae]ETL42907.1 hypothetical protein L916_06404 [Phytophthora nicotianae]